MSWLFLLCRPDPSHYISSPTLFSLSRHKPHYLPLKSTPLSLSQTHARTLTCTHYLPPKHAHTLYTSQTHTHTLYLPLKHTHTLYISINPTLSIYPLSLSYPALLTISHFPFLSLLSFNQPLLSSLSILEETRTKKKEKKT